MKAQLPLDEKIRVQKQLCEEASYDLSRHADIVQKRVARLRKAHGIEACYVAPKRTTALPGIAAEGEVEYRAKRRSARRKASA